MQEPRARFEKLARAPEGAVRLGEAALWIAGDEYPDLDVSAWLRALDDLGDAAAGEIAPTMDVGEASAALNAFLFAREGFRGNAEEYYDPRNSFLNDVLERRLGIPITLSVVYIEVAARARVTVRGVGLPGHFIVRVERRRAHRLVDPFHGGAALNEADCRALMQRVHGADTKFDPAHLRPVTTREIAIRMLANLKGIYVSQGDWPRALRTVDRMLTLAPEMLGEARDRGTIHAKLGDTRAAIRDWETYLRGAPEASDAERVRDRLRVLRQAVAALN